MAEYTVSASIVVYNGFEEAKSCIASVLERTGVPLSAFLIDNASPDGSGLRMQAAFSGRATVLLSQKNLGYGGGHNLCLPLLESDYHAVINPDITLQEDTLRVLCDYMQAHPDVVMVTPQLRFPDGRIQQIAKRTPTVLALAARQLHWKCLEKYENYYLMLDRDLSVPQDVQFCSGCFFVVRTSALKSFGGFDPDYFMYVEDADITRRALRCGRAVYMPATYVYHSWHRATRHSFGAFWQQLKSMMLYFHKWGFCFGFAKKAERLVP